MATTNEYDQKRWEFAIKRLELNVIEHSGAITVRNGRNVHTKNIHPSAIIGDGTIIQPGAQIGPNVTIGRNCLIKAGAIVGYKGFSFGFTENNKPIPFAHTGGVIIGDNCSIGSAATVCRATVDNTIIGNDVHIDDHVHVPHNVIIGENTCIAAGTMICGGVTIGRCVWIGVNASILNQLHVADYTLVGNQANVTKEFEKGDVLIGNPAKVLYNRMKDFPNEQL